MLPSFEEKQAECHRLSILCVLYASLFDGPYVSFHILREISDYFTHDRGPLSIQGN